MNCPYCKKDHDSDVICDEMFGKFSNGILGQKPADRPAPADEALADHKFNTAFQSYEASCYASGRDESGPAVEREPICHELKTHPPYFAEVVKGNKTFELRKNDRDFRVGDKLRLCEYEPTEQRYTGNVVEVDVSCLAQGVFGLPADVCVMSIQSATLRTALADLVAAVEWYGEKASAMAIAFPGKKEQTILALCTELTLDGGNRAGKALSAARAVISEEEKI